METIIKPKRESVGISGAETLAEMQDIDFPWGKSIDQSKDTYALVFRKHPRGQYALEMIRKVDDDVPFVDGVCTVTHDFRTKPLVQVIFENEIKNISNIEYKNNELVIVLDDNSFNNLATVILS